MMCVDFYIKSGLSVKLYDIMMCVDFYNKSGLSRVKTKGHIDVG